MYDDSIEAYEDMQHKVNILVKALKDLSRYLRAGPITKTKDRLWCIKLINDALAEVEQS